MAAATVLTNPIELASLRTLLAVYPWLDANTKRIARGMFSDSMACDRGSQSHWIDIALEQAETIGQLTLENAKMKEKQTICTTSKTSP